MIFGNPINLWWLLLLIGLAAFEVWQFRKRERALSKLFPGDLKKLMLRNWDEKKHFIRIILFILTVFFLILSLAKPQWGKKQDVLAFRGIDVIFAIDTSKSMLAEDLRPNRLKNAKNSLNLLVDQLVGNRLGLVAFAGSSFIQTPLTTDIGAIKLFLESIDVDLIPNPGTDIGGAIEKCVKAFGKSKNSKVIIFLTDGEDLDGSAVAGAELAAKNDIRIFAVGLGSLDGAVIPAYDKYGRKIGFKKDDKGEAIITRANPELLKMLAEKTSGHAFLIKDGRSGFQKLFAAISALPKQRLKSQMAFQYKDRFQIFLFIAICLLIVELIISERKK